MMAAISVAAAAGNSPTPAESSPLGAFSEAFTEAAKQYPALTIVGGFITAILIAGITTWIVAYYGYRAVVDRQKGDYASHRRGR